MTTVAAAIMARREHNRINNQRWRVTNPVRVKEIELARREKHRAKRNAYSRLYNVRNRAHVTATFRVWRAEHPEMVVARRARRRNREVAGGNFTAQEFADLVLANDGRCSYCGVQTKLGPDHRVPLCRGGSNTIENITPCCFPCNRKKNSRTEQEFRMAAA